MKLVTVVGARPQFVKAAAVSRKLREHHREILVHTGQHYDYQMSGIFFDGLGLPKPEINLGVGSGTHSYQTAAMLQGIENLLLAELPDCVLIYGDTNSTLAAALAASKLLIPVAHIEAGLRSFNRSMPEEINRVVADHLSDLLLCPSNTAVDNLAAEGLSKNVHIVGDVMFDILKCVRPQVENNRDVLDRLKLREKAYLLVTVHRSENTDNVARLVTLLDAFNSIDEPIVFPVHPRTRKVISEIRFQPKANVELLEPLGFVDMVTLSAHARMILTDSGGLQKEAYWLGVPCLTLRNETEWIETVETGWNLLVGANATRILEGVRHLHPLSPQPPLYGDGTAADKCVDLISSTLEPDRLLERP